MEKWRSSMQSGMCSSMPAHAKLAQTLLTALLLTAEMSSDIGNVIIDLTLSDDKVQPGDSFELPYSPMSDVSPNQTAADVGESSGLDSPLVTSEPADISSSGCVVISNGSLSDSR